MNCFAMKTKWGKRKERRDEEKPEIPFRDYANVVLAEQKKKK